MQIAAVISGYRHHPAEVVDMTITDMPSTESANESPTQPKTKNVQVILENTGIVVGYQLNQLVEAIKENAVRTTK